MMLFCLFDSLNNKIGFFEINFQLIKNEQYNFAHGQKRAYKSKYWVIGIIVNCSHKETFH